MHVDFMLSAPNPERQRRIGCGWVLQSGASSSTRRIRSSGSIKNRAAWRTKAENLRPTADEENRTMSKSR